MPESEMHTAIWSENLKGRTAWKTSEDNIKKYIKTHGMPMKSGLTGLEQEPRNRVMNRRGPKITPEFLH